MLIAVAADGKTLDARVEPVFGRADYFLLVSTEDMDCKAVENPFRDDLEKAGRRMAALLHEYGAVAVLCGECGPKARLGLAEAGIRVGIGFGGSVRGAVERFLSLEETVAGDS
jgi:predicted Fe-Mo cluster-binding NifX family protein